jgi:hypothetical protein
MSRSKLPYLSLATLVVASCSSGGFNYWFYPEPRLTEPEEAIFVAHENHRVLSIDGEELTARCTGEGVRPQAYHRSDVTCRFHLRPGRHSVVFQSNATNQERMSLDFAAQPGKTYGLTWTGCGAYLHDMDGHQKTCRVQVEEIKAPGFGGLPLGAEVRYPDGAVRDLGPMGEPA